MNSVEQKKVRVREIIGTRWCWMMESIIEAKREFRCPAPRSIIALDRNFSALLFFSIQFRNFSFFFRKYCLFFFSQEKSLFPYQRAKYWCSPKTTLLTELLFFFPRKKISEIFPVNPREARSKNKNFYFFFFWQKMDLLLFFLLRHQHINTSTHQHINTSTH